MGVRAIAMDPIKRKLAATPQRICSNPSDLGSQALMGQVSTWMGDRLGIPGAASFCRYEMQV